MIKISESAAAPFKQVPETKGSNYFSSISDDYTIGEALEYLNNIVKEKLLAEVRVDYKEGSEEYKKTNVGIYLILFLHY